MPPKQRKRRVVRWNEHRNRPNNYRAGSGAANFGGINISTVENKGRYYIAKIVRPGGSPIQRLLIDKQTDNIQMIGR
jgi:hypothetical protein